MISRSSGRKSRWFSKKSTKEEEQQEAKETGHSTHKIDKSTPPIKEEEKESEKIENENSNERSGDLTPNQEASVKLTILIFLFLFFFVFVFLYFDFNILRIFVYMYSFLRRPLLRNQQMIKLPNRSQHTKWMKHQTLLYKRRVSLLLLIWLQHQNKWKRSVLNANLFTCPLPLHPMFWTY